MVRRIAPVLALLVLAAGKPMAASVHLRTTDGTWVELEAAQQDGSLGFTISPDQTDAGRALVVVNKPDWMVLDDESAPRATGCALGEGQVDVQAQAGGPIDLGGLTGGTQLTIDVVDDANPIDPASARLRVGGGQQAEVSAIEQDRDRHSARFAIDLTGLSPGAYDATLEVADLAPLANMLSIPVRFSIAGAEISADRQTIRLSGGGAGFTVRGDRRETVTVDAAGVSAFLSVQPAGEKHVYVREFAGVEDLGQQGEWRLIDAEAALIDIDDKVVTPEEVGASVSYRFAVHAEIPALVVRSTATNLADARSIYSFWGWLPGDGYVTSDGERHEWMMTYEDIGRPGWVYLPPKKEDGAGVGWISDEAFGESRFGTMLLYTDPKKPEVATDEAVEMTFALMPATDIEQVAETARRLIEEGMLDLQ